MSCTEGTGVGEAERESSVEEGVATNFDEEAIVAAGSCAYVVRTVQLVIPVRRSGAAIASSWRLTNSFLFDQLLDPPDSLHVQASAHPLDRRFRIAPIPAKTTPSQFPFSAKLERLT